MNSDYSTQVSVIVLLYNSSFDTIQETLLSILNQKDIVQQIIVADDGSKVDYFKEVDKLFKERNFTNYKFSKNKINQGTCINYYNALLKANGEYVKPLSPGDYLYNETTLIDWYNFVKENEIKISFGKAIYFVRINEKVQVIVRKCTQPALSSFYKIENYKRNAAIIDNLILCDCVLGASYFCQTKILLEYISEILGKIRLCEDFAYRLMLLDGFKIIYYDSPVIYYSFGSGVTHKKDSKGINVLYYDEIAFDLLLKDRVSNSSIGNKVKIYVNRKSSNRHINRLLSFLIFPKAFWYRIKRVYCIIRGKTQTGNEINEKFIKSLGVNI